MNPKGPRGQGSLPYRDHHVRREGQSDEIGWLNLAQLEAVDAQLEIFSTLIYYFIKLVLFLTKLSINDFSNLAAAASTETLL